MSIKLVDSLQSMGDFPVAFANSIECADGTDLETKLSTLGGTGGGAEAFVQLSQDEYDALPDDETGKLDGREYRTYDTGHIYQLGVEFGKETDISSKQDNLNKVKFTMRRNGVNEPRYCLIGKSDLNQTILMNEPYIFEGVFGSNTSSDKKSIITLSVSFKNGADKDNIFRGYADCADGFQYVDLVVTVDEENMAYAYVDFKQESSLATGSIRVPSINTEYYMDLETEFVLVDSMQGTELCRMSDYAKIITNIDDTTTSSDTVWSSKKTSDKLKGKLFTKQIAPNSLGFDVDSTVTLEEFLRAIYNEYGTSGTLGFWWSGSNEIYIEHNGTKVKINGGIFTWQSTNINIGWQHITAIYAPNSSTNTMYKMFFSTGEEAGNIVSQGIEVIPTLSDTSSTTSTYSSAKINELNANRQVKTFDNTNSSTEKWYKICSALTVGIGCNIKLTASRADSTATVQYFSVLFRDNRYRYTSTYLARERTVYESELVAEYSDYIIADANNDIWVHVPSYGKAIIEVDTRAVVIDGTAGTPVKDYVYNSFDHRFDGRINDSETNSVSTWSSSKIAQQDGIKSVFYASSTAYPSILWVLSDVTTGVFWFKHTLSDSTGVKSVEGYADLTHDTVRLISGSDINVAVGTDTTSGKKGVRFTVAWGDNTTTSCKITEARPVTAIPTQIVSR